MEVVTNFGNIEWTSKVQTWFNEKKEKVAIPQPNLRNTNKHVGGIDHQDWLLEKPSIAIRGKIWYWCLFKWIIDMALVNRSILYRNIQGSNSITMKDFWKTIAVNYLKLGIGKKVLKEAL